jgi:hypothetical protein
LQTAVWKAVYGELYLSFVEDGCTYKYSILFRSLCAANHREYTLIDADDSNNNANRSFANRRKNNYMSYTKRGTHSSIQETNIYVWESTAEPVWNKVTIPLIKMVYVLSVKVCVFVHVVFETIWLPNWRLYFHSLVVISVRFNNQVYSRNL